MSSQRMSAQGPSNNGLARTDPYAAHTTQCTGSLREIALWLLLAAFLLMLLSDAAHAAERGTPGLNIQPRLECQPTRSKPYAVKRHRYACWTWARPTTLRAVSKTNGALASSQ